MRRAIPPPSSQIVSPVVDALCRMETDLLTMQQAAEMLGCTPKTLRALVSRGTIRAYRLGPRQIRLKREDVLSALQPIPTTHAH